MYIKHDDGKKGRHEESSKKILSKPEDMKTNNQTNSHSKPKISYAHLKSKGKDKSYNKIGCSYNQNRKNDRTSVEKSMLM